MPWTLQRGGTSTTSPIEEEPRNTWTTAFSQLQSLVQDSERKVEHLAERIRHMQFMVKLYRKQVVAGRVFVHESPAHAKSWALPCIKKMAQEEGIQVVEADQCMFWLRTWGKSKSQLMLAKNPRSS